MMPINFYDLGIGSEDSARLLLVLLVGVTHIGIFLLAKKIGKYNRFIFLPNFLYLLLQPLFEGYALWLDTILVPLITFSAYFVVEAIDTKRIRDFFYTGLFLGSAVFFKQVISPLVLVVFTILLLRKVSVSRVFVFLFGFSVPCVYLVVWLLSNNLISDFVYWSIIFNFEVYAKMASQPPGISQLVRVLFVFLPTVFIAYKYRSHVSVLFLFIFLLFSVIFGLSRFELIHLQPALPFASLLLGYFFISYWGKKQFVTIGISLYLFVLVLWSIRFYTSHISKKVYFFDSETRQVARYVEKITNNSDKVFTIGVQPTFYVLADRLPPGNVYTVQVPWNTIVTESKILDSLVNDPPNVIVRDSTSTIDGKNVNEFMPNVSVFVKNNYFKTITIGNNEVLIRK